MPDRTGLSKLYEELMDDDSSGKVRNLMSRAWDAGYVTGYDTGMSEAKQQIKDWLGV